MKALVCNILARGFYVIRHDKVLNIEYLHANGQWYPETCIYEDGKCIWNGWFKTKEEAQALLEKHEIEYEVIGG